VETPTSRIDIDPRELARYLAEILIQRFPSWSRSPKGWKVVLLDLMHDYSEMRGVMCWTAKRPKSFMVDGVIGIDAQETGYPTSMLVAAHCEMGKKWENQVEDFLKLVHLRAELKLFFSQVWKNPEEGQLGLFEAVGEFRQLVSKYSGKIDNYLLFLLENPGQDDAAYKVFAFYWPGGSAGTERVLELESPGPEE